MVWCRLLVLLCSLLAISTIESCSPPANYHEIGLVGRSILAPNVVIARVKKIKSDGDPFFVPYSACVFVERILKNATKIPKELCISEFGGSELCLLHVHVGKSYVMFLNRDRTARYDDLHGAAHIAVEAVVSIVETGICQHLVECELPTISTNWKDKVLIKEGEDLDLVCSPSGTGPYVITWFWNNNNLDMRSLTETENRLQIKQISSRWSGKFTCVVKSPAGEVSRSTIVEVDPIPCGGHLILETVKSSLGISSLNFPKLYPRDKTCKWRICPPKKYRLKLEFFDFTLLGVYDDVEISFECISNGSLEKVLWGKFCGTSTPGVLISTCKSECVIITHHSRSNREHYQLNTVPIQGTVLGFKAKFQPTEEESTKENFPDIFCSYDFIFKGRVKTNGIISLIVEVLESYYPKNSTIGKEFRLHYRYPLQDRRSCPVSIMQGDTFVFLGVDKGVFHRLVDVYKVDEIRHRWLRKLPPLTDADIRCRKHGR